MDNAMICKSIIICQEIFFFQHKNFFLYAALTDINEITCDNSAKKFIFGWLVLEDEITGIFNSGG